MVIVRPDGRASALTTNLTTATTDNPPRLQPAAGALTSLLRNAVHNVLAFCKQGVLNRPGESGDSFAD